ncbi:Na/Pi cotransporter family protein [Lacibacterium aquatile]|uniref:Na/Pi cotransporter family protein n=1 Tax=Lacibacterium aquatile TaxID=1168082 RepID=A0ABW5DQ63_9PROT
MSAWQILLHLIGNVVLLLWGLYMVKSGVIRAFGADLRRFLGMGMRNRWTALLSGAAVTTMLQSSTATGLMAASFAASGTIALMPALALMLGANIGTTVIVQLVHFDISLLAPVFLLAGYMAFRQGGKTRTHDLGRVGIGLGLMLLALYLLLETLKPVESAPVLRHLLGALAADPFMGMALAAVFTWAAHSSVAVVLLISSLAGAGVVEPQAALAMVAGANLGSAVNPIIEGPRDSAVARRLPMGNLINRLVGCVLVLAFLPSLTDLMLRLGGPVTLAANFHVAFNLALAALFILPLAPFAKALERYMPERGTGEEDLAAPKYLDPAALDMPELAVANAGREVMRMSDTLQEMMVGAMEAVRTDDRKRVALVRKLDDRLDQQQEAIKRYLAQLRPDDLDEATNKRVSEVLAMSMNIEHAGDILDHSLLELVAKKIKRHLSFSAEGREEILGLMARLVDNGRLATSVFLSGDKTAARQLIGEKETVRRLETKATEAHFDRLRAGRKETLETSALHLDFLRDLRRINAHLTAGAGAILEEAGELRASRLRSKPKPETAMAEKHS